MRLIGLFLNLLHLSFAYIQTSETACSSLIRECHRDSTGKCGRLYGVYFNDCKEEYENLRSKTCSRRCRRSFKSLLKHPLFTLEKLKTCTCGESMCVKQKCKLLSSCLEEECIDEIQSTTPSRSPPSISTFSSTPSGHSITMSSSTVALGKVNCETVIAHCSNKDECDLLLRNRDKVCEGFTVQNQHCTPECAQANQLLKDNFVGQHLTTCKFETPSHQTTLLTTLIMTCLPRDSVQTQSPTYRTEQPSRPVGDCKRQFMECTNDMDCQRGYNKVMKECKRKTVDKYEVSTCTTKCVRAVGEFRRLGQGENLWGCSCTGQLTSRRCDIIKHTFSDICSNEPCVDTAPPEECTWCTNTSSCNSDCGLLCKKSCERCPENLDEPTTDGPFNQPLTLTTRDETLATSAPTSTEPLQLKSKSPPQKEIVNYYRVNVTCEEYMNVRIDYSAEINYSPHFTAEDKNCEVEASPPGSRTATLRLEYNPPSCGTRVLKTHASENGHYRVMKNRIYVRSVGGSTYNPIQEIECRIPVKQDQPKNPDEPMEVVRTPVQMSFFTDRKFTKGLTSFVHGGEGEDQTDVYFLGRNYTTVYVELKSDPRDTFVLETCFATPNGRTDYSTPYYFLKNGCLEDKSFNAFNFYPTSINRFGFYRIMFNDNRFSGRVFVHCKVRFCKPTDKACSLQCRNHEMVEYEEQTVTQGPYTFPLAVSHCLPIAFHLPLILMSSLLLIILR